MAVFTTVSKNRLNWEAPEQGSGSDTDFFLDIGDGFALNIGDGFSLIATPAGRAGTPWSTTGKQKLDWPAVNTETTQLNIGNGFNLNVGDGFVLEIGGEGRSTETEWTTISRNPSNY